MSRLTQAEMILEDLQKGYRITALDALKEYGCFRLASRISDLKKTHDIRKVMITVDTRRGKTTVASYYIPTQKGQGVLL